MNWIIARGLLIPFLGTALGSAQISEAGALSLALGIAIQNFPEGAMIFVVVEELVPEMAEGEHSNWGTILFMLGFTLMMILDVALG